MKRIAELERQLACDTVDATPRPSFSRTGSLRRSTRQTVVISQADATDEDKPMDLDLEVDVVPTPSKKQKTSTKAKGKKPKKKDAVPVRTAIKAVLNEDDGDKDEDEAVDEDQSDHQPPKGGAAAAFSKVGKKKASGDEASGKGKDKDVSRGNGASQVTEPQVPRAYVPDSFDSPDGDHAVWEKTKPSKPR